MSDQEKYRGKTAVVTGASSGFGRGVAVELARRGTAVVLAARSVEALREVVADCERAGGKAVYVVTDVSERQQVEELATRAVEAFGRFDVWLNNAGVASIGTFDDVPAADHEQVIRTNLVGAVLGSHAALRHFRRTGRGVLVNIASVIGKIPAPYYASYAASKFGIVGLSAALRQELAQDKASDIRVCTVMPMAHSTEFFEHAGNYTGHEAVPIPPTYDPSVTIDAVVRLVADPKDEIMTGWQGNVFGFLHRLMPDAVQMMMRGNTAAEIGKAPPAAATAGNVHEPSRA